MKTRMPLIWNPEQTPAEIHPLLDELGRYYPIRRGQGRVTFKRGDMCGLRIDCENKHILVTYARLSEVSRSISHLLAGLPLPVCETPAFDTAGLLLDCSRNAVPTLDYLKEWVQRMALFGFNLLSLYTEDTFQMEGEPFFGFQRGGYSKEEIRELDRYAALFGIELVPCMQSLGHMEQMMRWECYQPIRDHGPVMFADNESTYAFIAKMIDFWASAVRSRRIHVGMDEAHALGRGKYLDKNGGHPPIEILLRHLSRVHAICKERGLQPMMWSDMLVPHSNAHHTGIPADIASRIPPDMELVCWDYYQESQAHYLDLIRRHGQTHRLLMSPGVWCWGTPWYGCEYTEKRLPPAIAACRQAGIREVILTMWNDDGAYGDLDSSWNGVALAAEELYGGGGLKERYAVVFGGVPYERNRKIAVMNDEFSAMGLLWDDPLLGIYWHQRRALDKDYWSHRLADYVKALAAAGPSDGGGHAGDLPKLRLLLRFLMEKIKLRNALESAVSSPDKDALGKLALRYRRQATRVRQLSKLWRKHWNARYKPFGFEVLQNRLAAQAGRQEETALRLQELAAGRITTIPELDAPDVCCATYIDFTWRGNASGSIIV